TRGNPTTDTDMRLCLTLAALALMPCIASAAPSLKVFPGTIELRGQDDRLRVVVQVIDDQGITKDVTSTAKLRVEDTALVTLSGSMLTPKKDGGTRLIAEHEG